MLLAAVACAACGRGNFEPILDARANDGQTRDSGGGGGDGAGGGGEGTCASPTSVVVGTTMINTCVSGMDVLDGCGPPGTQEIVLRWDVVASGTYTIQARDAGSTMQSNQLNFTPTFCGVSALCTGSLMAGFTAGDVMYFVLEAASGTCADIDFVIE